MKTITDCFEPYIGTKEYNGIVKTMIEWYYGHFAKVAWCAISCSYMANQLGISDQFGGKNDNVYHLMKQTEAANKKTGKGLFKYASKIKKGTVIKRGTVLPTVLWANQTSCIFSAVSPPRNLSLIFLC